MGERQREYNCVEPVNKNTIKEKHTQLSLFQDLQAVKGWLTLHFEHVCKYLQFLPKVHFPILNALHK
jgi:hypothetical protein